MASLQEVVELTTGDLRRWERTFRQWLINTGRWRNDVGRRLADLEIVLGTHRREVQVKRSKSNP